MRGEGEDEDVGRQNYKDPARFFLGGNLPMKSSLRGICSPSTRPSEQVSILRDLFLRGTKRIRGISS